MKIGIVDADLIGRKKHRFPNLACEKISGWYKDQGNDVSLITRWDACDEYDEIFVSKVFTDTPVPEWVKDGKYMHLGGTGFYFDQAPPLPDSIEHHMPDYRLYDEWIEDMVSQGVPRSQFKEYTDYSIGFLTRGCFRKCKFCVNQKYNRVSLHSPLEEFFDPDRKKICLLDDNFFGSPYWQLRLEQLISTGKPFKFKQGMDERILTDKKCEMLFSANYDSDYTFAFDNIEDYDIIHEKLKMIRRHTKKHNVKFYVLVGFKGTGLEDILEAFERIELLGAYGCLPYIMRYHGRDDAPWEKSKYRGLYIQLARWCNQPSLFRRMTLRQFCERCQDSMKTERKCAPLKALEIFEKDYPDQGYLFDKIYFKEDI